MMSDFEVGAGNNLTSFTALVDGAERFENQDWGPVKQHYQQKMLEGGYTQPAITNTAEKGSMGKASMGKELATVGGGKQQLATQYIY